MVRSLTDITVEEATKVAGIFEALDNSRTYLIRTVQVSNGPKNKEKAAQLYYEFMGGKYPVADFCESGILYVRCGKAEMNKICESSHYLDNRNIDAKSFGVSIIPNRFEDF